MPEATSHDRAPRNLDELESHLSTPTAGVIETLRRIPGDILVLGVGGKMGPTLARMAKRASELAGTPRRVIGVSRFSDPALRTRLNESGIETISCNLLDEHEVTRLPEAPLVISMAGFKFGADANPSLTWAMNCYMPAVLSRRFRHSRIVAFSSGNVYGLVPVASGGSIESDTPRPVGEYAMTVLGRERMFDYFSRELSIPMVLLRLNYATELRYGVLVDLGRKVWNEEPIDVSMGYVNVIWQTEANAMSLESLAAASSPPRVLNIAGNEFLRIRDIATRFAEIFERRVEFTGEESNGALLNNATASHQLFGKPQISAQQMIEWTAQWISAGGASLNKPTHFESRDGKF
jgi:nucleoside-diphosphate-sugar epimerase